MYDFIKTSNYFRHYGTDINDSFLCNYYANSTIITSLTTEHSMDGCEAYDSNSNSNSNQLKLNWVESVLVNRGQLINDMCWVNIENKIWMENKLILFAASTILTQFQRIFDFKFEEYATLRTIISIIPGSGINFVEKRTRQRSHSCTAVASSPVIPWWKHCMNVNQYYPCLKHRIKYDL